MECPNPARQAAFRRWADSIASGRIAELKETELHGPFMQTIAIEALGYRGPVVQGAYSVTRTSQLLWRDLCKRRRMAIKRHAAGRLHGLLR